VVKKTRRDFLKQSAKVGATAAASAIAVSGLSACTQLDRLILGDSRDLRKQVVILGAGAAGLSAALELRKRNIPFRVFEASDRWGGRVLTLNDFNVASQSAEMGAEWIYSDHQTVFNLARELKVNLLEVRELLNPTHFWFGGKLISENEMWRGLRGFRKLVLSQFPRGSEEQLDKMSLQSFIKRYENKTETWIPLWAERVIGLDYGTSSENISALSFVSHWLWESREPMARMQARRYKIEGGTAVLINALYNRVAGIIPGQFVQMNHEFTEVRERLGQLELRFNTPDGKVWVQAQHIICTIPFSILRQIKGFDQIQLSANKLKVIADLPYGTGAKANLTYPKRVWKTGPELTRWSGDFFSQWMWQGDVKSSAVVPVLRSILTSQWAGIEGRNAGPSYFDKMKSDLQKIFPKSSEVADDGGQIMNWSRHKWSLGSVAYFAPGQAQDFSYSLREPERDGKLLFAGEHVSRDNPGTLQGAIETGTAAAEFLSQLMKV
jgi:monoamine oxidase